MTIKDLARLSGYSLGTVSRVLNNQPNVSEKARQAILSIAQERGFELNESAQLLKQQRSNTVLIIVKGTANELFAGMVEHLQSLFSRTSHPLIVDFIDEDDNEVLRAVKLCRERKPMGVMFLGATNRHFVSDFDKIHVTVDEVSRPGLHLAGFFDHFEPMRIYVCGTVEVAYLQKLSSEERSIIFDHFLSYMCPALIFARGYEPSPECLEIAKKYDVTVLRSKSATSYLMSALIVYLKNALAPRVTRHGVLVEIYGEGVLINGDSGIGKSETAIELVKRGHRLIADDAVEIKQTNHGTLVATAAASASSTWRSCLAWARSRI